MKIALSVSVLVIVVYLIVYAQDVLECLMFNFLIKNVIALVDTFLIDKKTAVSNAIPIA